MKKKNFTLIELLVVIAIIGILAAIILPAMSGAKKSAEQTKIASQVRQIHIAVDLYLSDYQSLPSPTTPAIWADLKSTGNARGKTYYNGPTDGVEVALDTDYDGNVTAEGETVSGNCAIWKDYEGNTIKSWNKN